MYLSKPCAECGASAGVRCLPDCGSRNYVPQIETSLPQSLLHHAWGNADFCTIPGCEICP